jgi:hypothetical protein
VRVKTKADAKIFRWTRLKDKNGNLVIRAFREPIGPDDFCVLVDLTPQTPEYFVCSTASVQRKLAEHFEISRLGR